MIAEAGLSLESDNCILLIILGDCCVLEQSPWPCDLTQFKFTSPLGIWLKCRRSFRGSGMRPESLHFSGALGWCCCCCCCWSQSPHQNQQRTGQPRGQAFVAGGGNCRAWQSLCAVLPCFCLFSSILFFLVVVVAGPFIWENSGRSLYLYDSDSVGVYFLFGFSS